MTGEAPGGDPGGAPAPRGTSGALLGSLALSALTLALPALGLLGPLGAGILAFLGYRKVRASGGRVHSRGLAIVAMSAALGVLALQGRTMIRNAPTLGAWNAIRARVAEVEVALRTGTAESAWDLLSADARRDLDHDAFVGDLRAASAALGPLVEMGDARATGGDWERTTEFNDMETADLRLPMLFLSRFERGRGRIRLEVRVRRIDRISSAAITSLTVEPAPP